ncbi:spermatogenesis-associated protein [Pimephales promelas]|nr:spermatogenesis-associated protein [Pimephales promelas]
MCQLSEEARQRLSHIKLGPYTFKKETVPLAPFVVPRSPNASLMSPTTFGLTSQSATKKKPATTANTVLHRKPHRSLSPWKF